MVNKTFILVVSIALNSGSTFSMKSVLNMSSQECKEEINIYEKELKREKDIFERYRMNSHEEFQNVCANIRLYNERFDKLKTEKMSKDFLEDKEKKLSEFYTAYTLFIKENKDVYHKPLSDSALTPYKILLRIIDGSIYVEDNKYNLNQSFISRLNSDDQKALSNALNELGIIRCKEKDVKDGIKYFSVSAKLGNEKAERNLIALKSYSGKK